MTQEQFRIEVQTSVKNFVDDLMITNNIPAAMMEDALNKVLVDIKDQVLREFIVAASRTVQEQPVKEEDNGGE